MADGRTRSVVVAAATLAVLVTAMAGPAHAALTPQCQWPPPSGTSVAPASTDVMMSPVVADLDGDDLPEIVIISFEDSDDINTGADGTLRILRGDDCTEVVSRRDFGCVNCVDEPSCVSLNDREDEGVLCPGAGVAVADLDLDGDLEITALSEGLPGPDFGGRRLLVFDHLAQLVTCGQRSPEFLGTVAAPAIAQLDGAGAPEIVTTSVAWKTDGTVLWANEPSGLGLSLVADLDADGSPEVVAGETAYRADGTVLWARPELRNGQAAVADFDGDCIPEIVLTSRSLAEVHVLESATGVSRCVIGLPGGIESPECPAPAVGPPLGQGGAPTLADIDGDCVPEIGVAGCVTYNVFRYDSTGAGTACLTQLWSMPTDDSSSRVTGSTLYDLEGDGSFEVLYGDHRTFWIFDADDGSVVQSYERSNFTLVEHPTLVDSDADGEAEILIVSNDYTLGTDVGVTVLHDPDVAWVPTRPIWNQHSFHLTNIDDDGIVPDVESRSWEEFNNYRVQITPSQCTLDPDPEITVPDDIEVSCDAVPKPPEVTATDACDPNPSVVLDEVTVEGPCPDTFTLRRTWTATDDSGNTASGTQVVSVSDTTPPVFSDMPESLLVECTAPAPPVITVVDDCDPDPSLVFAETITPGPCPQASVVQRTWTTEDRCGNDATIWQVVTVMDTEGPTILNVPPDAMLACDEPLPPTGTTVVDGCDPNPELVLVVDRIDRTCPEPSLVIREWTATDACGNTATARQVLTIECCPCEECDPCELAALLRPLTGAPDPGPDDPCFGFELPDPPDEDCCATVRTLLPVVLPGETTLPVGHPCAEPCTGPCVNLDFEDVEPGDEVTTQLVGVTVSGSGPLVIFDTGDITCEDDDLATPGPGTNNDEARGHVLVLQEAASDCRPDDEGEGGLIELRFDDPSEVTWLGLLDIDEPGGSLRVFGVDDLLLLETALAAGVDNSWQRVDVQRCDVTRIELRLAGSGALTEVRCESDRRRIRLPDRGDRARRTAHGRRDAGDRSRR
ncbi:MAG: hypothetical protein AAF533_21815 [Acidobacteriota bacterium]